MPNKITHLTDEQKSRFKELADKWISIGLSTERADRAEFEQSARTCMRLAGQNENVPIIWVPSPMVGAFASSLTAQVLEKLKSDGVLPTKGVAVGSAVDSAVYSAVGSEVGSAVDSAVDSAVRSAVGLAVDSAVGSAVDSAVGIKFWHEWFGGQFWAAWSAYLSAFTQVCGWTPDKTILDSITAYEGVVRSACYWWPNKDFIMVSERPLAIQRDSLGRLHSESDKAIVWPDGWGLYMWHGTRVPDKVIHAPETITRADIMNEKNSEVSRAMAERLGWDKYLKIADTILVDKWFDPSKSLHYELWDFKKRFERTPRLLKMESPELKDGTRPHYIEPINPGLKTCQSARRWQFPEDEDKPNQKVMFGGKWMSDGESVEFCNEHPELEFSVEC